MKKIITFGEIMLRLAPPGFQRLTQARSFEATYGGGEANVAVSLANYGETVEFVTRLPNNDLGDACLATLRGYGVGTSYVARGGERIGIYFLETGAAQRASKVIYDRAGSSFATVQPGSFDWKTVFAGVDWFHWTGITPAVSQGAAEVCREAILAAREVGGTVSCDLNYRAKLWKWGKPAGEVMSELVAMCDLAIGNEEDAERVFGIKAPESDVTAGKVEALGYRFVCEALAEHFPSLKTIAITLRGSLSASYNTWSGVLWSNGEFYSAPTYDIFPIVDRVGGGDAFMGGIIYGLRKYGDPQKALDFAAAAACLKHSIPGDFNLVNAAEVETLMAGDASGAGIPLKAAMRLVTFRHHGQVRLGAQVTRSGKSCLLDLNEAQPELPADILLLLRAGASALQRAREALASADEAQWIPESEAILLAPLPRPGKILCVGHNYRGHLGIGREELPEYPNLFCKTANTITGTGQPIFIPKVSRQVDYEAELMVVIGKTAWQVSETDARAYIAGYTIFNDVSARDYQKRTSQWLLGKSFDTFGPMGPALVTADEIPDPHCLDLELTVNGVPKQRANTRDLIFSVPFLVAYLSAIMTLEPGDVIATGTPAKLPEAANPQQFLEAGDVVRITIEKLGTLENPVTTEASGS